MSDPYAACRFSIDVIDMLDAESQKLGNPSVWVLMIDYDGGNVTKAVRKLTISTTNITDFTAEQKDQLRREMALPIFATWVAGKLGAM
jgi:hypothetical protein